MELFYKSISEAWSEFALENGAEFIEGSFVKPPRLKFSYKECQIQIETYSVQTGSVSQTYTRIIVPFVRNGELEFRICRAGIFSELGKVLGMHDIEIGDDEFDKAFKITGNEKEIISQIFRSEDLMKLLSGLESVHLEIKRNLGAFGPHFKDDEAVLLYQENHEIKDKEVLADMVELIKKMIDVLIDKGVLLDGNTQVDLS